MRQLLGVLISAMIVFAGMPAMATGQSDCDISNTGPDSENICETEVVYTCEINNNNEIRIFNNNNDIVYSGVAQVEGNTEGGSAQSGTAGNSNTGIFDITITNGDDDNPVCAVARLTEPEKPVQPEPKPEPKPEAPGGKGEVKVLPVTSGDNTILTMSLVAGSVVILAGTVGTLAYRHNKK